MDGTAVVKKECVGQTDQGKPTSELSASVSNVESGMGILNPWVASGGNIYEVEKIVGMRTTAGGKTLYKVRWKGFPEDEDSWVSYQNLSEGRDQLIEEYKESLKKGLAKIKEEVADDTGNVTKEANSVRIKEEVADDTENVTKDGARRVVGTSQKVSDEESQKNDDTVNGGSPRRSASKNRDSFDNSSERSGPTRHNHWKYETVEVMTPEEWNRFGNLDSREIGGLYIPDRIPTETERLLCNFSPDVGRVTRNKLKSVLKTEASPSKDASPSVDEPPQKRRKKPTPTSAFDGLRSEFKTEPDQDTETLAQTTSADATDTAEESTFSSVYVHPKAENLDDVILKDAEDNAVIKNRASRRGRRGSGRGRGGSRNNSRQVTPTPAGYTAPSSFEEHTSTEIPASSQGKSGCSSRVSQIGNWRILAEMPSLGEDAEPRLQIVEPAESHEQETATRQKKQEGPPPGSVAALHFASRGGARLKGAGIARSRTRGKNSAPRTPRKRKRKGENLEGIDETQNDATVVKESEDAFISQASERMANVNTRKIVNARSLMLLEVVQLPFPISDRSLDIIWMDAIRTHQLNREKPLTSFSEYRQAALDGDIAKVRWTGRCVPDRRGFDINSKYRGKTIPTELCEKSCNASHDVDDMLVQVVRDGMRLDITDDVKGRVPLHFAVEKSLLCRIELLLHLRSPVNLMDKDKKTPMDLIMISRGKAAVQEQMIYQLLRFGADADDALRKLPPVLPPHRQGFAAILMKHQQRVNSAFNDVRTKTLVDMSVKRILTPVYVRPIWEAERYDLTTEIGFGYKTVIFPNNRYTYVVLLALADFRNPKSWRLRMWGRSPFKEVRVNGTPAQPLADGQNSFVFMARRLQEGWNVLTVKYLPEFRRKRLLLLAQVLLMQVHKPSVIVPQPVLERAPDNGTDFKADPAS